MMKPISYCKHLKVQNKHGNSWTRSCQETSQKVSIHFMKEDFFQETEPKQIKNIWKQTNKQKKKYTEPYSQEHRLLSLGSWHCVDASWKASRHCLAMKMESFSGALVISQKRLHPRNYILLFFIQLSISQVENSQNHKTNLYSSEFFPFKKKIKLLEMHTAKKLT